MGGPAKYIFLVLLLFLMPKAKADEFDQLRTRWYDMLVGGDFNVADPDVKDKVNQITSTALGYWTVDFRRHVEKRDFLWSDLDYSKSAHLTASYRRLVAMALAYRTKTSTLYKNDQLKNDLIKTLKWLYKHHYNERGKLPDGSKPRPVDNWWDYKIGAPLALTDVVVLLFDELQPAEVQTYMHTLSHFIPNLVDEGFTNGKVQEFTAANRVWICTVIMIQAILIKDKQRLDYARDKISPVFAYASSGDGFYMDGSFIQHDKTPYNGGYGIGLLDNLGRLIYLLDNTGWKMKQAEKDKVFAWIRDSFVPVVTKSGVMAMVTGREVARKRSEADMGSKKIIESVLLLSEVMGQEQAAELKSTLKRWFSEYTALKYKHFLSILHLGIARRIENDRLLSYKQNFSYRQFPHMDRAIMSRPLYTFGVSMHSSRIYNYERINNENLKGWHTGDGMTYLYNGDHTQYEGAYWPTLDFYRLPGTTVEAESEVLPLKASKKHWVGGVSLNGRFGLSGMYLAPYGQTLEAKKSWFMFDNEVVALGAGIFNRDGKNIHTYIEQRKLAELNDNQFFADDRLMPVKDLTVLKQVKWAHLSGPDTNAAIGYYFPDPTMLHFSRKKQSGRWTAINQTIVTDTALKSNTFLTMWYDHGQNSADRNARENKYSYVLLPGMERDGVKKYSLRPDIIIIENSAAAQVVAEQSLNIIGSVFWNNRLHRISFKGKSDYLTCNAQAAVMLGMEGSVLSLAVSDPTMINEGEICITVRLRTGSILKGDPAVRIEQLASGTKFIINAKGLKGRTVSVSLRKK